MIDTKARNEETTGRVNRDAPANLFGLDPRLPAPSDPALQHDPGFASLLAQSYQRYLGTGLLPPGLDFAAASRWLYEDAPFCLLVHNTAADPRFIYANRTAQICFEFDWNEITSLPSRLSAETPNQAERQRLLEAVTRHGFATGYRGLRIAKSGRRFWIEDVTMWQLKDKAGHVLGQAASYASWRNA